MSVAENYLTFLVGPPAMRATDAWTEDEFVEWLDQRIYRAKVEVGGERLAWYLFEEIGWPEGRGYVYDAIHHGSKDGMQFMVANARSTRFETSKAIDSRLELRRAHWKKPGKLDFLMAHRLLMESIQQFKPDV